jgi:hypothetical protein
LTYNTVNGNVVLAVFVPSVTLTVIVLVPSAVVTAEGKSAVGTMVIVPSDLFVAFIVTVTLAIRLVGLLPLLEAVTVRLLLATTGEFTLIGTDKVVFSGVTWAATVLIVGAVVTSRRVQPPAILPLSGDWSSCTYSDQVPFGSVSANALRLVTIGPAGMGS